MNSSEVPGRVLFSIAVLSSAIIAYQLALMQILAITQWYHFAYMVISIALLGFGAAGTFLSIYRKWFLNNSEILAPLMTSLTGVLMAAVSNLSQLSFIRFDTYLLFSDYLQVLNLLITYLLFFLPFFAGALVIGIYFTKFTTQIGKLYFANMAGSGLGGIIAIVMMWIFFPVNLPIVIAVLPLISASLLTTKNTGKIFKSLPIISLIFIGLLAYIPSQLHLSQFKNLSKAIELPGSKIVFEKNSPYGLIQVLSTTALRFAPGLSLKYKDTLAVSNAVFNNGNWLGAIISKSKDDSNFILDHTTHALPYTMGHRKDVLVLNSGTGIHLSHAVSKHTDRIKAIEPNPVIISLMKSELASQSDSIYYDQSVTLYNLEPRTFIESDNGRYDLVLLPDFDAFGGASGLYSLQEQYILTKEAISELRQKLTPDGLICITCWNDYPVRNPLKVLATMTEVLQENGLRDPSAYIISVRSWGNMTFGMKRSPITEQDAQKVREFCSNMLFDPVLLPGLSSSERNGFNKLQDTLFFTYIDEILSPQSRNELISAYDFNLKPATDNNPYFSQFLKWESIPHLADIFGSQTIPFFELGYLVVVLTLVQVLLVAVILIILPLFKIGWKGSNKLNVVLYFSGIGLGYMFIEIVLIQRFLLFFGSPIYASAAVISAMLICSGIGSCNSSKLKSKGRALLIILSSVIIILLVYSAFLTIVLKETISLPLAIKVIFAFAVIAPPSYLMGFIFPIGITLLSQKNESQVPWAWGINGCVSVVSTALATVVAVELGFVWVMVIAAGGYFVTLVVSTKA